MKFSIFDFLDIAKVIIIPTIKFKMTGICREY